MEKLKSNMAAEAMLLISVFVILLCCDSRCSCSHSLKWAYCFSVCVSSRLMLSRQSSIAINLFSSSDTQFRRSIWLVFITCHLMPIAVSVLVTWKQGVVMVILGCIPGVYECLLVPGPLDVVLRSGEGGGCTMETWL